VTGEGRMFAGIDIGSTSVAAVILHQDGRVIRRFYEAHRGDLAGTFSRMRESLDIQDSTLIALTGRTLPNIEGDARYDSNMATLASVRRRYPGAGAVLVVGGERFTLLRYSRDGEYSGLRTNTPCAAGTGSFLDQQALRLALGDSAALSEAALRNEGVAPKVATRCAVFAKTDLIHAQQEGYSLPAIAEGLCRGLAKNLADTLFKNDEILEPVVFTGGVALNAAVVKKLRDITGLEILMDEEAPYHGAIGAALLLAQASTDEMTTQGRVGAPRPDLQWKETPLDRAAFYPPLELHLSEYPDFHAHQSYREETAKGGEPVEVDIYRKDVDEVYLGIDIGSTSTKAALVGRDGEMVAGFYTRTAGRPVQAFQAVFLAVSRLEGRRGRPFTILACATTGSGRKFVGSIVGSDLVIDEISAHARAAYELDEDVDTIIEIGGQDAKFTTLRDGRVSSSIMNTVCAAGTGSFIEEQAKRLGVGTEEYAELAWRKRAPRVSDRCTVFMERDINHLLSAGCTVPEVLAAALHAVRENYLRKVAVEKAIGKKVFFQGATAKNRALVAAFEQRLGRPILVSRYCHLTGAYGAALSLADAGLSTTKFKGIALHDLCIPIRNEVCELCTNHCKLTVAKVGEETCAFGFLCGRDYEQRRFVPKKAKEGLGSIRDGALSEALGPTRAALEPRREDSPRVGIPSGLALTEDLHYWRVFFSALGICTVVGRDSEALSAGKERSGAEFCAPMSALHGSALGLLDKVDYVFLPVYLEKKERKEGGKRYFCYYSQFSSALISQIGNHERFLTPLVTEGTSLRLAESLRKALAAAPGLERSIKDIMEALGKAETFRTRYQEGLLRAFRQRRPPKGREGIEVLLLGRPYTVLDPRMNKGIPELFEDHGVRVWYQDMVEENTWSPDGSTVEGLRRELVWEHGKRELAAAEMAARTEGLYPVLLSSFKCGPDSFIAEYFQELMEAYGVPYLVLELDEHDSSVGYETRIEAAIRAFRNHRERESLRRDQSPDSQVAQGGLNPRYLTDLKGKTLLVPCWDDLALPLFAAVMRAYGVDAQVLAETEGTIRASLSTNDGQCLPLNAIAESFMHSVRERSLDPGSCAVWIPKALFACNIPLYAHQIKRILEKAGGGFERSSVYVGEMALFDIHPLAPLDAYLAFMFAGVLRRLACRIRPYEKNRGQTDKTVTEAMDLLTQVFSDRKKNKIEAAERIMERFEFIPYDRSERRPLVAVFGDIYVRDNAVMNQDVIGTVERNGGEVVSMPYNQYMKMVAETYFARWMKEGMYATRLGFGAILAASKRIEKSYYRIFQRVLGEQDPVFDEDPAAILEKYEVHLEHSGESVDNILKTWYIKKHYPEVRLFVQLSPAFCCAGLVTEAMKNRIEEITGVPVLAITYDGTGGPKNEAIIPYLKIPRSSMQGGRRDATGSQGSELPLQEGA